MFEKGENEGMERMKTLVLVRQQILQKGDTALHTEGYNREKKLREKVFFLFLLHVP